MSFEIKRVCKLFWMPQCSYNWNSFSTVAGIVFVFVLMYIIWIASLRKKKFFDKVSSLVMLRKNFWVSEMKTQSFQRKSGISAYCWQWLEIHLSFLSPKCSVSSGPLKNSKGFTVWGNKEFHRMHRLLGYRKPEQPSSDEQMTCVRTFQ